MVGNGTGSLESHRMKEHSIWRYSPNRTDPDQLEAISVEHDHVFDETDEKIVTSATTKSKHHMVFVGPRGSGKTHLVSIVCNRLSTRKELADKLLIARLNEDETSSTFLSLMLRIYSALSSTIPEEFPAEYLSSIYDFEDPSIALDKLATHFKSLVGNRTVLLIVENLDAILRDFNREEQKNWRAFFQNNPQVFCILGTAQRLSDDFSSQDSPFFGFFNVKHLKPFDVEEAKQLLLNIAELNGDQELQTFLSTPKGRSRVRALHHLTGGNQRLFIILSDFANCESLDDLVGPFEELADEQLTPYYQERLRWISTQQRMIVEYLCKEAGPVPVKSISRHLFIPHSTVTGQLKHLREMGYVIANKRGKESLYELAEPLMRLSFQIKEVKGSSPLRMIVDFLRVWYERTELESLSLNHPKQEDVIGAYVAEAIKLLDEDGNLRERLIRTDAPEFGDGLSDSELDILEDLFVETQSFEDAVYYICSLVLSKKKERAIDLLGEQPISGFSDSEIDLILLQICLIDYFQSGADIDEHFVCLIKNEDPDLFKQKVYFRVANAFAWCSESGFQNAELALERGLEIGPEEFHSNIFDLPAFFFAHIREFKEEGFKNFWADS